MKVKILVPIDKSVYGLLINLRPGQIISVTEEFAEELVEAKQADYEITEVATA